MTIACTDAASSPILRTTVVSIAAAISTVAFVVDPRHLLVARRHYSHLPGRAPGGIADDARRADGASRQIRKEPRAVGVVAHDADSLDATAERDDVVRHVGRAAEPPRLVIEADDRHRRLRRDPLDRSDDELIDHQVANHQDRSAGKAVEQAVERREAWRRHYAASRSSASAGTRSAA